MLPKRHNKKHNLRLYYPIKPAVVPTATTDKVFPVSMVLSSISHSTEVARAPHRVKSAETAGPYFGRLFQLLQLISATWGSLVAFVYLWQPVNAVCSEDGCSGNLSNVPADELGTFFIQGADPLMPVYRLRFCGTVFSEGGDWLLQQINDSLSSCFVWLYDEINNPPMAYKVIKAWTGVDLALGNSSVTPNSAAERCYVRSIESGAGGYGLTDRGHCIASEKFRKIAPIVMPIAAVLLVLWLARRCGCCSITDCFAPITRWWEACSVTQRDVPTRHEQARLLSGVVFSPTPTLEQRRPSLDSSDSALALRSNCNSPTPS